MKNELKALAKNPFAYVIGFSAIGSASIVAGVAILAGAGWALVASGTFLIAASNYITKGLKPNG